MAPFTPKTIMAPAAAFCMAWVLFAYTRSSISQARWNAQQERAARKPGQDSKPPSEGRSQGRYGGQILQSLLEGYT